MDVRCEDCGKMLLRLLNGRAYVELWCSRCHKADTRLIATGRPVLDSDGRGRSEGLGLGRERVKEK